MALVPQILIAVALLAGLISVFLSAKNWHWTQVVLVLFVFLSGLGVLYLATKTASAHKKLRANIPRLEKELADAKAENEDWIKGTDEREGLRQLEHRLAIAVRDRGRVWRQVRPVGQLDAQKHIEVEVLQPQPHSIEQDAIIFAFEAGPPDVAEPDNGAQYLGEFRVVETSPTGVKLEPVHLLHARTGKRIDQSQGPWSLYETMPADRHELFANFSEKELRELLPAKALDEHVRHGTPATADDDQWDVIGLDENDERVGPDKIDTAVKRLYSRPLRDYAILFGELAEQRVVMLASIQAVAGDNRLKETALKSAEELGEFREEEIRNLAVDLTGMERDREAIESHRDMLLLQLKNAQQLIDAKLTENSGLAAALTKRQLGLLRYINSTAPAPASLNRIGP